MKHNYKMISPGKGQRGNWVWADPPALFMAKSVILGVPSCQTGRKPKHFSDKNIPMWK